MPKFYCKTGDFKTIVNSSNMENAVKIAVCRLADENACFGPLIAINERGFSSKSAYLTPIIPIIKDLGMELPDDDVLAQLICNSLNITIDQIDAKELNWLLTGYMD